MKFMRRIANRIYIPQRWEVMVHIPWKVPLMTFLLAIASLNITIMPVSTDPQEDFDFKRLVESINYEAVFQHMVALSALGSRVTGYLGSYAAADYIREKMNNYGLNVTVQTFTLASPIDRGSTVFIHEKEGTVKTIKAYSLWPNLIQTCRTPKEISGKLIYAKDGELKDFNGKVVRDSIVLMDFNSGKNWLNAAKLGAKAVIFIEPPDTTYFEAMSKFIMVPIHFPRLYVSNEDGELLRALADRNIEVSVKVDMQYEIVKAENIIGIVRGYEFPDDIIVVMAHYDTWSVIPSLAPGADEAASVSLLLELARYFSENPPRRTVWFVALSGHYQALAGAREFTEHYFFSPEVESGRKKMWVFMGIDISTDGNNLALLYRGHMYDFGSSGPMIRWTRWLEPKILKEYLPRLEVQMGRRYNIRSGFHISGTYGWWASIPIPFMIDSEPMATAHGLAFTVRTDGVFRIHWGHPFNTLDKVNIENLKSQAEVIATIAYGLANEREIEMNYADVAPARYLFTAAAADLAGFMTVNGKVWFYNVTKGWYSSLPDALVVAMRMGEDYTPYPFSRIITITNKKGEFTIHGVSGYGYGHGYGRVDEWYFEAYHLNEDTGLIDYAPDYGQYGQLQVRFTYQVNSQPYNVTTVVFRSSSIVIFDLVDASSYRPREFLDPRFQNKASFHAWTSRPWLLTIYNARDISQYIMWGQFAVGYEDCAMIFVPPNTRAMVVFKAGANYKIVGLLTNTSSSYPEGRGFLASPNEELHIIFTSYRFALDTLNIAEIRYTNLESFYIRNPVAREYLEKAKSYLMRVKKFLAMREYDKAYSLSLLAWSYSIRAYDEIMNLIYDTVNISLVIFFLTILFSVFFERLVFSSSGPKVIFTATIIFVMTFIVYINVHPAPKIAANVMVGPLSITAFILFLATLILFADRVRTMSKEFKERLMGMHFVEKISTVSLFSMALSQAPRNLRKRPVRSLLVLITIVTVIYSMVSLTSIIPTLEAKEAPVSGVTPLYQGILVKKDLELTPDNALSPQLIQMIANLEENITIIPRAWYYPPSVGGEGVFAQVSGSRGTYRVKAFLGLSHRELNFVRESLVQGRWFERYDYAVCLLSKSLADRLGVSVGDIIEVLSFKFLVVGIYDSTVLNELKDLDNYVITPANPDNIQAISIRPIVEQTMNVIPLSWDEVIVVPFNFVIDKGGYLASVTLIGDTESLRAIGKTLAVIIRDLRIYVSDGERVYVPSPVGWFSMLGWNFIVVPLIVAGLTVFNTIIASIKERVTEIEVYSAVGLSPKGITLIFISESMLYAVIGSIIGYLAGIVTNILLVDIGYLPESYVVNFSSLSTVLGIGIPMLCVILASIYPSYLASRLITPSLERKWKIPTKPRRDRWEIPLPFSAEREEEVIAIFRYLQEYFSTKTVESEEPFIVQDIEVLHKEKTLKVVMQLMPAEAGVRQEFTISSRPDESGRWTFNVHIKRLSGVREIWFSTNYRVVDAVRKQLLLWRSLSPSVKAKYLEEGVKNHGV